MNDNPLATIADWLDEARALSARRNPLAMALSTCSAQGRASVRMVLAKAYCAGSGHLVFYTHYGSRKSGDLDSTRRAAAVFYWEEFGGRQLRIAGPVTRAGDAESDAYFAGRPVASQINAWVSEQSRPLDSLATLQRRAAAKAAEFGLDPAALADPEPAAIARPRHWGGYRLWVEEVEFWLEGTGRFHERLHYQRTLSAELLRGAEPRANGSETWRLTRLQP